MPDVQRSDSQRSDTSLRPRVSFNRDVHVKRIVPREGSRVTGALNSDGNGQFLPTPIRKERLKRSKQELAEEAKQVLQQVDKVNCVSKPPGVSPERFYTLPRRRHNKDNKVVGNYPSESLDRKWRRRGSLDQIPPKKPQRTFTSTLRASSTVDPVAVPQSADTSTKTSADANDESKDKSSVFSLFKKKKSNLRRSVSDASNLKSKAKKRNLSASLSDCEDNAALSPNRVNKKQLSPIIEATHREDYFSEANKENIGSEPAKSKSVTEKLQEFIDEVDGGLDEEIEKKYGKDNVEVVIIDLDKAQKIENPTKRSKLRSSFGKKLKAITSTKKAKSNDQSSLVKERIADLGKEPSKMIHSSQKPVEKLPLTKGRTVNSMVKKLNSDSCSPPPPQKPNAMVIPSMAIQHNNNQPFSYTRGLSPEKYLSDENLSRPIIYAQVVNNNNNKQTVHTAFCKKTPNSDSDEGLGTEEIAGSRNKYRSFTLFGDELSGGKSGGESPIMPKYRLNSYEEKNYFIESSTLQRGRADGMDSKRKESLTEQIDEHESSSKKMNLSARRDLLESRFNQRLNKLNRSGSSSPSPVTTTKIYFGDYHQKSSSKQTKSNNYLSDNEPKSFDSQLSDWSPDLKPSHHYHNQENQQQKKTVYKSTPNIYHSSTVSAVQRTSRENSYHDSLKRDHYRLKKVKNERSGGGDRFGDSGIENDLFRRDSGDSSTNYRQNQRKKFHYGNDSEDEGFASSLLINSERQHTEDNLNQRRFDSDCRVDDDFNHTKSDYVPRERSIDDGSHFDPRIDKDLVKEKVVKKKPPKPEKKSSLEKVKQLFSRDSKKKKLQKPGMVREESLRARYTEYRGSREDLLKKNEEEFNYRGRRRLSTPSPSPPRREIIENKQPETSGSTHTNWFKSLDRLSRKKVKKDESKSVPLDDAPKRSSPKNLRFFGDTDHESSDAGPNRSTLKHPKTINQRHRSQSSRELHNISENPELLNRRSNLSHKSLVNIAESSRNDTRNNSRTSTLKPPASPITTRRSQPTTSTPRRSEGNLNNRRRRQEFSSVESSTEGDSSQQSQRSIVYLHAATVGDIPGPAQLRGRRAASREDLVEGRIQPQVKTLSRSFSVLAPWRPKHYHEGTELDYSQQQSQTQNKSNKYEQQRGRNSSSRKEEVSTLKKKVLHDNQKRLQSSTSTLNRSNNNSKSKENLNNKWLLKDESARTTGGGSSSTLYKKKERLPRENSRYTKDRDDIKKMSAKSMSVESLSRRNNQNREISRSISMPKDTEKSAGWFKKKHNNKNEYTTHRL